MPHGIIRTVCSENGGGDPDVNVYPEEKLRSLIEGELRTLSKLIAESFAHILVVPCSSAGNHVIALSGSGCREQAEKGRVHLSKTHIKL